MKKSLVLLSSGMDSTVNLYAAKEQSDISLALTFDYGQRAATKELASAAKLAAGLKIPHQIIKLDFFKFFTGSSLLNPEKTIPSGADISMDDKKVSDETAKSVWVPNRNGIFLNIAAGMAENLKVDWVVPGFNAEEAVTFPDNSAGFLKAMDASLTYSTAYPVRTHCFTTDLSKTEIVKMGEKLGVHWALMWPCYLQNEKWCGQCESCQRSKRAFQKNNIAGERLNFEN
jgi:7-cyano-7-deazaguanine synthase